MIWMRQAARLPVTLLPPWRQHGGAWVNSKAAGRGLRPPHHRSEGCWRWCQSRNNSSGGGGGGGAGQLPSGEPRPSQFGQLAIDEPSSAVLGFAQWQGAGPEHDERYRLGGQRLARAVQELLPRATALEVDVAADEPGPGKPLARGDPWWGASVIRRQAAQAAALLRDAAPTRVVTVGGDCGVEPWSIAYLAERYADRGGLAVLWLDAVRIHLVSCARSCCLAGGLLAAGTMCTLLWRAHIDGEETPGGGDP
eukprot:COSAG01_NODE_3440_length_6092_cov_8.006503_3_plen_252_part_00